MTIKVAIVGAGPAGCMLARLLIQSGKDIKVTIFESEVGLDYRSQGGTLDLRSDTGLAAIQAAGLWETLKPFARYDGEALQVTDKKFLNYLKMSGSTEHKHFARPEVDRPILRRILFESLPASIVRWGYKLVTVDKALTLHFTDKPSEGGFDLVVGADGAWSKVRTSVSDAKPFYSGITGHQVTIPNAEADHKELYDMVNRGSIFSFSDGKSIMAQQMGDGSLLVGLWCRRPQGLKAQAPFDSTDAEVIRAVYKEYYHDWDPRLVAYTQQTDSSFVQRDLYMLPIGHSWEHKPGVTLIGDSAHLATPFAGIGVNIALHDALLLSKAIISAADKTDPAQELDANVKSFENDMFRRGKEVQESTNSNMHFMFYNENAPRSGIEKFILNAAKDELGRFTFVLAPVVYAYYFVFRLMK